MSRNIYSSRIVDTFSHWKYWKFLLFLYINKLNIYLYIIFTNTRSFNRIDLIQSRVSITLLMLITQKIGIPPKIDGLHRKNSLEEQKNIFRRSDWKVWTVVGGARLKTSTLMDRILTRKTRCSLSREKSTWGGGTYVLYDASITENITWRWKKRWERG